jgi:hypothetical protein
MSRNRAILLVFVAGGLTGCADYLNRYDTVTLAAGDAQKYNAILQTKDPFNPMSKDTAISTDGERASDAVIYKYKRVLAPGAAPPPVSVTINTGSETGTN